MNEKIPEIMVKATSMIRVQDFGNKYQITWVIKQFLKNGIQFQSCFYLIDTIKVHFVLFFLNTDSSGYIQTTFYNLVKSIKPRIEISIIHTSDQSKSIQITQNDEFTVEHNRNSIQVPLPYSEIPKFAKENDLTIQITIHYKPTSSFQSDILNIKSKRRLSSELKAPPKISTKNTTVLPKGNQKIVESYNSKIATNYVGLLNQGATCYMNSLLQALFHTPAFRRFVFQLPKMGEQNDGKNVTLNLQILFCRLQLSHHAVSTKSLTTSFGWTSADTFYQHDIQEFCRVLLDNLEGKVKGTELATFIPGLFRGKSRSFIRCINIEYESSRNEDFYDISLPIRGHKNLHDSFQAYIEKERLEGNNQYSAGDFGKQDADMGTEFIELPKILHIHLKRFDFNYETLRMEKVNDNFEFPREIDLSSFVTNDKIDYIYDLFGVLVHSGGMHGGHYYAFLRTSLEAQWYKFNDSLVTKEEESNAIDDNFGGKGKIYSAYMLIYVCRKYANEIYSPVTDDDIPRELKDWAAEAELNEQRKKQETEQKARQISVSSFLEDSIESNCLSGKYGYKPLFEDDPLMLDKTIKLNVLYEEIAKKYNLKSNEIRIWTTQFRRNPTKIVIPSETDDLATLNTTSTQMLDFFVQKKTATEPIEIGDDNLMVYCKFFLPKEEAPFQYIGHFVVPKNESIESTLFNQVVDRLGLDNFIPTNDNILVYEESLNSQTAKKLNSDQSYINQSITSGSLLILQFAPGIELPKFSKFDIKPPIDAQQIIDSNNSKKESNLSSIQEKAKSISEQLQKPKEISVDEAPPITLIDFQSYLKDINCETVDIYIQLFANIKVIDVYDIQKSQNPLFTFRLSLSLTFQQIKEILSKILQFDYNPHVDSILFFKGISPTELPTNPIDQIKNQTLKPYFISNPASFGLQRHRLYLELLKGISEEQVANSTQFKVQFSDDGYNVIYDTKIISEKKSSCLDILKKMEIDFAKYNITPLDESIDRLRFMTIYNHQIVNFLTFDQPFTSTYYTLRVDIISEDQTVIDNANFLIQCCHGYIDTAVYIHAQGNPFLFKVIKDEKFSETKKRLLTLLKCENENDYQFRVRFDGKTIGSDKLIDNDEQLSNIANKDSVLFIIYKDDINVNNSNIGSRIPDKPLIIYN